MQTQLIERTQTQQVKNTLNVQTASHKEMAIVSHMVRSSADWYAEFVSEEDMDQHYVDAQWEEKNFHQRDFYLGYNEAGDAVGTLSLQYFGDYAYIGYLYLDTKYVGNGYGRQFMDFAQKKALQHSKKGLYLIAHPEAKWAVKAYTKYGFHKKATDTDIILNWNQGCLKGYYEEGFELYLYDL